MKRLFYLLSILSIVYVTNIHSVITPTLLSPQYAHSIKPTDFNTGPVVISEPGYYVLTNDVIFNPTSPNDVDTSGNKWQYAILILADCVTLDLNTHSIQQKRTDFDSVSPSPYYSEEFKLIKLGGTNIYNTQDSTSYTPKHITIKNGCLNQSQGYGIYGKDNSNLSFYDLNICSCDIAGIFLQNTKCSCLHDIAISGSSFGAGNVYGIFLRDNSTAAEWTSDSTGSQGPAEITLEHIKVCNISTTNSLDTSDHINDLLTIACNKLDFSCITAIACTLPSGSLKTCADDLIAALVILQATITASKASFDETALTNAKNAVIVKITTLLNALEALASPTETELTLQEAVIALQSCMVIICDLIEQAIAISSGDKDFVNGSSNDSWSAYGIRITNGHSVILNHCSVTDTTSIETSTPPLTRATGIALDKCKGCEINNCSTTTSSVNRSNAIGFSVATNSQGNFFNNCSSIGHTSADYTFGYWLCNSDCQTFVLCESCANNTTRTADSFGISTAKGFYFENCNGNLIKECSSYCHSCTLNATTEPAQAIGFDVISGTCNVFDLCKAHNITADTAALNTTYQTNLLGVGFRLNNETNSSITHSKAHCCQGSVGIGAGIFIDTSTCSTIRNNNISTNTSKDGAQLGNGYGIYDNASDSTSFIVENIANANQTLNYKVSYSLSNEKLPLISSTYGDMTSLYAASPWENISLHANPGSTGCNSACTPDNEQ